MITKNPMQLKAFIKKKAAEKNISAQHRMQCENASSSSGADSGWEVETYVKIWTYKGIYGTIYV